MIDVFFVTDLALLFGPLQDTLLDAPLADESIDGHLLGLTQPVGPVHGLLVYGGVPVAVVEDDLERNEDDEVGWLDRQMYRVRCRLRCTAKWSVVV